MLERGGNEYTNWPLVGMAAILEKTACCSWDGEDGEQVGRGRQGCQSFMRLVGVQRVIHDHIRLRLKCRGERCGREVTISNQSSQKKKYSVLPAAIKHSSFSPYVLKLSLFHLPSGSTVSVARRMWQLSSLPAMSSSTHYAHQHVVWHFVHHAFVAEMESQRRRQEEAAARHRDDRRRLVLSADGSWAHKGYNSKQRSAAAAAKRERRGTQSRRAAAADQGASSRRGDGREAEERRGEGRRGEERGGEERRGEERRGDGGERRGRQQEEESDRRRQQQRERVQDGRQCSEQYRQAAARVGRDGAAAAPGCASSVTLADGRSVLRWSTRSSRERLPAPR